MTKYCSCSREMKPADRVKYALFEKGFSVLNVFLFGPPLTSSATTGLTGNPFTPRLKFSKRRVGARVFSCALPPALHELIVKV